MLPGTGCDKNDSERSPDSVDGCGGSVLEDGDRFYVRRVDAHRVGLNPVHKNQGIAAVQRRRSADIEQGNGSRLTGFLEYVQIGYHPLHHLSYSSHGAVLYILFIQNRYRAGNILFLLDAVSHHYRFFKDIVYGPRFPKSRRVAGLQDSRGVGIGGVGMRLPSFRNQNYPFFEDQAPHLGEHDAEDFDQLSVLYLDRHGPGDIHFVVAVEECEAGLFFDVAEQFQHAHILKVECEFLRFKRVVERLNARQYYRQDDNPTPTHSRILRLFLPDGDGFARKEADGFEYGCERLSPHGHREFDAVGLCRVFEGQSDVEPVFKG